MDLPIRYVGFEIPNRFAIGYGLDHAQRYRNLAYVAALKDQERLGTTGTLIQPDAGLRIPFKWRFRHGFTRPARLRGPQH